MGGRFLARVARRRMLLRNMVLAWRRDDGLLKSVKSFSCAGKRGSAGLRPAPAGVVPAAGRQQPKPKPKRLGVVCGLAGRCGLAGHAVTPPPGSGPAAGGWAFGRLRSSASHAKRPHPWGLDGAIHGANGPASPHRPTFDSFPVTVGLILGKDMANRMGSDPFSVGNGSDPGSIFVIRQRSIADHGDLSKAGWVRLRGREPHGCGDRAYMDVFTAPPATGPTPPSHGSPAFAVASGVAGQQPAVRAGAGRSPAEPPHAAPQNAFG